MPCATPRNTFIFTAMSGPSTNPQAGGPLFLAEYTSTNHISGGRLHPQHRGRARPWWQEPTRKLVWQQITEHAPHVVLAAHSALYGTRSYIPAVRITRVTAPAKPATGLAYTTLLGYQPSPCSEPGDRVGAPTMAPVSFWCLSKPF